MEISPVFQSRCLNLEGCRKVDDIKAAASALLDAIEMIDLCNENARMIALARTKLEEAIMWSQKAVSREPFKGITQQDAEI